MARYRAHVVMATTKVIEVESDIGSWAALNIIWGQDHGDEWVDHVASIELVTDDITEPGPVEES